MKTFDDLKSETTSKFIKWMCEMAEGFELDDDGELIDGVICPDRSEYEFEDIIKLEFIFPLLLHRAVEGLWKDSRYTLFIHSDGIYISINKQDFKIGFKQYQLTQHLTACEMAIWDCLIFIYKEEK